MELQTLTEQPVELHTGVCDSCWHADVRKKHFTITGQPAKLITDEKPCPGVASSCEGWLGGLNRIAIAEQLAELHAGVCGGCWHADHWASCHRMGRASHLGAALTKLRPDEKPCPTCLRHPSPDGTRIMIDYILDGPPGV